MTFSETIRAAREAAGLTQAELAQRAGVTERTVSRTEHGRHAPSPDTVRGLCEALGLDAAEAWALWVRLG